MTNSLKIGAQVLFFSRGKGRGHAVPDAAIATDLLRLAPTVNLTFVSYSSGSVTLKDLGWKVIDLELPEDNLLWDTVVQILLLLQDHKPDLVVSHEEFCAVPVSRAFRLPIVFLTDWFIGPESIQMQSLKYADEIIFLDDPGYYDVPPYLIGKISYVGPVIRALEPEVRDKAKLRSELSLPLDATVILVAPGGAAFHSEARAPIVDLVFDSYNLLDQENKRLVWVVDSPDYDLVTNKAAGRSDIVIMKPHREFINTMMAADLIITKGNRVSVFEAEALGIPSISIASGQNLIDEWRVCRIRSNTALRGRGLDKMILRDYIITALATRLDPNQIAAHDIPRRCLAVAERLRMHLNGSAFQ